MCHDQAQLKPITHFRNHSDSRPSLLRRSRLDLRAEVLNFYEDFTMKNYVYSELVGAFLTPIAGSAVQPDNYRGSGHYEWRIVPRGGSYIGAPRRKHWVPDKIKM